MALPSKEKTWVFDINNACGGTGANAGDNKDALLKIKNALLVLANDAWTVWGSCDGTGGAGSFGNGDSSDRWVDVGDLIGAAAASNHSWIVLTQDAIASKYAICIDMCNTNTYSATIVVSPKAGFGTANGGGNGTATARPTASDEIVLVSNTYWGASTAAWSGKFHIGHTNDGKCTWLAICVAGRCQTLAFFMVPSVQTGVTWTGPSVSCWISSYNTDIATVANFNGTANLKGIGASSMSLYLAMEGFVASTAAEQIVAVMDTVAELPMLPNTGLWSITTGNKGKWGRLYDVWFGSTITNTGDSYPGDSTRQFWQLGDLILPGDGSTALQVS